MPTFLSWCFVLLYLLPLGDTGKGFAQINLVPNPSFEIYSSCPNNFFQIKKATGWDSLKAGGGSQSDFFNACDLSNTVGVPYNIGSFQYAKNGVGYVNVMMYYTQFGDEREYIQSQLLKKLQTNKTYCVTFFVTLVNYSTCGIDQISAYLDDGSVNSPPDMVVNGTINPQVSNPTGSFITDTLNWIKIQGVFVANGSEEYITIGNFKPATLTNTVSLASDPIKHATYYIDDVSVIELDSKAYAGEDKLICVGDSVFIGRNPEIGLECEWFSNITQIGTGAGIWVKPDTVRQYIIKQDVCGTISYDTVQVSIKDVNCKPYVLEKVPNTFTPNNDGVNDTWQFSLGDGAVLNGLSIYNRWGNLIHSSSTSSNNNTVLWDGRTTSGEPCSEGVYFYVLNYTDAKGEQQNKTGYISLFR